MGSGIGTAARLAIHLLHHLSKDEHKAATSASFVNSGRGELDHTTICGTGRV